MVPAKKSVNLLGTVELLHRHLDDSLCEEVFDDVRDGERRRLITLSHLAEFWTAVVLRAPRSLKQALGQPDYPSVPGSPQAFFARSKNLHWEFFARVFERFVARVRASEQPRYAGAHRDVLHRFGGDAFVIDGSSLDQVARRLRLLWNDRRVPLPGSVVATYSLVAGTVAGLEFDSCPQGKELPLAYRALTKLRAGSLVIADRLYGLPRFFAEMTDAGVWGITRRSPMPGLVRLERLSPEGAEIEEWLVDLGTAARTKTQRLRLIGRGARNRRIELVTNVLDRERLTAQEALDLYAQRWNVERLFYDLKEVLNLHCFYAANTNAVAMQVFAAAIVHVALRTAQGRISHEVGLEPERLSTAKLFPKVAAASVALTHCEIAFQRTQEANPGHRLTEPDWRDLPAVNATLDAILVEPRTRPRKRIGRNPDHARRRPLPPPPPRPRR